LIKIQTHPATNCGLTFAGWVIREAHARTKVRPLALIWSLNAAANGNQLVLSKVKIGKAVVNLAGNTVVLPSQAQIPGQAVCHFEIILDKSVEGAHSKTVGHRKLRLYCLRRSAGQKCGEGRKRDAAARCVAEVVIPETAEFPTEFHRMPAVNPRE